MRYLLTRLTEKIMKYKIKKQIHFVFIMSIVLPIMLVGAFPLFYTGSVMTTQYNEVVGSVVLDDTGKVYSSTDNELKANSGQILELAKEHADVIKYTSSWKGTVQFGSNKYYCSISLSGIENGKNIYVFSFSDRSFKDMINIILLCLLLLIVALLIAYIVMSFYASYFSQRVGDLRKAMHAVSNEKYEVPKEMSGEDEISQAYDDLCGMVGRIKEMDASVYEAKINSERFATEQQMMEYKMLASQINPHFLYNTLEAIRMRAISCDDKEVANAIKLLGKSLRYVLENTGTISVPLSRELNYILTYIKIIQFRFADKINYSYTVDESIDADGCSVLPLLLQPIVENAVLHGLENVVNGNITLTVTPKDDDIMCITIADDGCGMDEEQLEAVRQKLNNPGDKTGKSIGLYNIHQRLKLFYGEQAGMSVESKLNEGTSIKLDIPMRTL